MAFICVLNVNLEVQFLSSFGRLIQMGITWCKSHFWVFERLNSEVTFCSEITICSVSGIVHMRWLMRR